jgi:hypothetical protein
MMSYILGEAGRGKSGEGGNSSYRPEDPFPAKQRVPLSLSTDPLGSFFRWVYAPVTEPYGG